MVSPGTGGHRPARPGRSSSEVRNLLGNLQVPVIPALGQPRAPQRSGIAPPTEVPSFAVPIRGEAARDRFSGTVDGVDAAVVSVAVVVVAVVVVAVVDADDLAAFSTDDGDVFAGAATATRGTDVLVDGEGIVTARVVVGDGGTRARESGGFGGRVPGIPASEAVLMLSSFGSSSTKGRSPGRSMYWINRSTMIGVPGDETTSERPVIAT